MLHARINTMGAAGGGAVAAAVIVRAQKAAALGDFHAAKRAAGVNVVVLGQFPGVARHVKQSVAVGRKAAHGRGAVVAVFGQIF